MTENPQAQQSRGLKQGKTALKSYIWRRAETSEQKNDVVST